MLTLDAWQEHGCLHALQAPGMPLEKQEQAADSSVPLPSLQELIRGASHASQPLTHHRAQLNQQEVEQLASFVGEGSVVKDTGNGDTESGSAAALLVLLASSGDVTNHGTRSPAGASAAGPGADAAAVVHSEECPVIQQTPRPPPRRASTGLPGPDSPHPKAMVNMLVEEMAGDMHKVWEVHATLEACKPA